MYKHTTASTYYQGIPRTVNVSPIGIPPSGKELYMKEQLKSDQIEFSQGVFQLSGYIYYAVQRYLVLFKFSDLISNDIENAPYSIT